MAKQAGSSGFRILVNTLTVGVAKTAHYADDVENDLRRLMEQMVEDAKQNAPWQDNTGSAREGLDADLDNSDNVYTVTLFHTVDYGQWLETIQSGRFAIILPTIEKWAPQMLNEVGGSLVD